MNTTETKSTHKVFACLIYAGQCDFWSGSGARWHDNAGCLFAHYDKHTTIGDLINDLVGEYLGGSDCDSFPESVTTDDVRDALLTLIDPPATVDSIFMPDCEVDYDTNNADYDSPCAIALIEIEPNEPE